MDVIFTALARQELMDAKEFYNLELPGLGDRFTEEVRKSILRLQEYPLAWSIESGDIRKCLLHRFPYKILYAVEQKTILIIAIAHQHRKPDYWIDHYL